MQKASGQRARLTRNQKLLLTVAVVLAVLLLFTLLYRALFVRPELRGEESPDPSGTETIDWGDGTRPKAGGERKSEDFYTVLILGRDTGGGGNTDTMLLASYDVTNQRATVMSIPRDTMVNVSWDVKKINSVYNGYGGGDKGIQGVYKEISQLVGFEPDYQVVVEWEAVGKIVDAIGGVWFDVPYDMHYKDPYQDLVIDQAKGYRLLTGDDAMQVIRWRKNNGSSGIGDSGRMEIQQDFLKAVIQQMMQPSNVMNINKIAKVFQENVETDLSFQNILWFGKQAFTGGLSVENVTFITMPYRGASAWSRYYQQELDYVVPIADELLDIVNNQLSPFKEVFTLSDLDIMSVNADGSLRSTTGRVEDSKAAVPPVKPDKEPDTPAENDDGNSVDPVTGEPIKQAPDASDPNGGTAGETGTPDNSDPGTGPGAGTDIDPDSETGTQEPDGGETAAPGGADEGTANPEVPQEPQPPAEQADLAGSDLNTPAADAA